MEKNIVDLTEQGNIIHAKFFNAILEIISVTFIFVVIFGVISCFIFIPDTGIIISAVLWCLTAIIYCVLVVQICKGGKTYFHLTRSSFSISRGVPAKPTETKKADVKDAKNDLDFE